MEQLGIKSSHIRRRSAVNKNGVVKVLLSDEVQIPPNSLKAFTGTKRILPPFKVNPPFGVGDAPGIGHAGHHKIKVQLLRESPPVCTYLAYQAFGNGAGTGQKKMNLAAREEKRLVNAVECFVFIVAFNNGGNVHLVGPLGNGDNIDSVFTKCFEQFGRNAGVPPTYCFPRRQSCRDSCGQQWSLSVGRLFPNGTPLQERSVPLLPAPG